MFNTFSLERFAKCEVRPFISLSFSANWSWIKKKIVINFFIIYSLLKLQEILYLYVKICYYHIHMFSLVLIFYICELLVITDQFPLLLKPLSCLYEIAPTLSSSHALCVHFVTITNMVFPVFPKVSSLASPLWKLPFFFLCFQLSPSRE